jgi:hypothetical protein
MKEYFTFPILGLCLNFIGALMITLSSGKYKGNQITFFSGDSTLNLNHPSVFRWGIILIVIGFFVQLIAEILKVKG